VKYLVRLTVKAEQDVDGILRWFQEQRAPRAAQRWLGNLFACINTLESHPQRCAAADESKDLQLPLQELLVGKRHNRYRVIFQVQHRTVYILRVWHSSRDVIRRSDL
jgi:plasmid stabilization system protein ParE